MAFKFNAILKFSGNQAIRGFNAVGKSFSKMQRQSVKFQASLGKVNQGMRGAALATAPLAIGVAFATKTAADFEAQLSVVRSVLRATPQEMAGLNSVTKQLGVTTAFTAKQAGEGAEFLARAGFTSIQIMSALPGVLDAAAASGVSLGEAADVVAGNIGAFGLKAADAGRVADALSLTTALTNTNFTQLSESMKFAAPIASQAGLSLESTATAMGVLANAGVKGSLAGTALKDALLKLAKPSKEGIKLFGSKEGLAKATLELANVNGRLVQRVKPLEVIMANISKVVANAKNPLEATAAAAEIFGLRGTTAFSSFDKALKKTQVITNKNVKQIQTGLIKAELGSEIKITEKNFESLLKQAEKAAGGITTNVGDTIPSLVALRLQINGATGTAKEMASIRLDNVKGQFTLLNSAVQGLSIEMGELVQKPLKNLLKVATDGFAIMAVGFQIAKGQITDIGKATKLLGDNQFAGFIVQASEFAKGFIDGLAELKKTAISTFNTITKFLKPIFGGAGLTAKEIGKIAAKIIIIGAIAAPVFAGIVASFFVLGPVLTGISGLFGIITAVIGGLSLPLIAVVAGIALAGAAFFSLMGGVQGLKEAATTFADGFMSSFVPIFNIIKQELKPAFDELFNVGKVLFDSLFGGTRQAKNDFTSFGSTVGKVASFILTALVPVIKIVASVTSAFVKLVSFLIDKVRPIFKFLGVGQGEPIRVDPDTKALEEAAKRKAAEIKVAREALIRTPGETSVVERRLGPPGETTPPVQDVTFNKTLEIVKESNQLQQEKTSQTATTQSASAQKTAQATAAALPAPTGAGAQGGQQNITVDVNLKGAIKGNDINLSATRAKVRQTQLNGGSVDGDTKRRLISNGERI